jgi:Zinc knuckle
MNSNPQGLESQPRDENGKIISFDGTGDFWIYRSKIVSWAKAVGFGAVFRKNKDDIPIKPRDDMKRIERNLGNREDCENKRSYLKDKIRWENICQKAMAGIKRTWGEEVREYLKEKMDDYDHASRGNIQRMMDTVEDRYGSWTAEIDQLNTMEMQAIPVFKSISDVTNGCKVMTQLIHQRESWRNSEHEWNDTQKRTFLLSKMEDWKELEFTLNTIRSQPTLKYRKCRKILDTTVDRLRAVSILKTKTALATAALVNPIVASLEVAQRLSATVNDVSSSMEERLYGRVAMQEPFKEMVTDEICMVANVNTRCFHCKAMGHLQRDCPALYCKFCNKTWSTKSASGYHFFSDCKARKSTEPLVSDSFMEKVPLQVRADSRGGSRGSSRGVYGGGYI